MLAFSKHILTQQQENKQILIDPLSEEGDGDFEKILPESLDSKK